MTKQQHRNGTVKVIVLVLLLYVFSLFFSGFLSHQGLAKAEAGIAFKVILLIAGLVTFWTRDRRPGDQAKAITSRDLFMAGGFVTALVIADVLTMAGQAATDPNLGFAKLPPFGHLAAEQALAAFGEELLFTGFLFSTLRLQRSFTVSVAIVATIFVALHWPSSFSGVMTRAAYVIAACAIFERTQSILLVIAMHLAVNGLGFIAVLLMGDEVPQVLLLVAGRGVEIGLAMGLAIALFALISGVPRSARIPR